MKTLLAIIMAMFTTAAMATETAVATAPQAPARDWATIAIMVLPWLITILTVFLALIKAKRDGKTWMEALHVAVNTLKVEDKMIDGEFKEELVSKAGKVSEALQVSKEAKEKVEQVLKEGREVKGGIKLASINGQPIYLADVAGVGSALSAALQRLRKIKF